MVGYGPQPNECIERLREFPHICVAGNHDWAALDKLSQPRCSMGLSVDSGGIVTRKFRISG
jgi:hypothetical protein